MDPVGSVEKIVKLALTIKAAADTVRHNKEECHEITTRVARVSALLSKLPEAGVADDPATAAALEDLEEALRRAHTLVAACQERSTVCLFCAAGRQAKQLRRVQDDISQKMMLVVFATNVKITIILGQGQNHPRPQPQQQPLSRIQSITTTPIEILCSAEDSEDADSTPQWQVAESCSTATVRNSAKQCRYSAKGACYSENRRYCSSGRWRWSNSSKQDVKESNALAGSVSPAPPLLCRVSTSSIISDGSVSPAPSSPCQTEDGGLRYPDGVNVMDGAAASSIIPDGLLKKFDFQELDSATHHFSEDNIIGRGSLAVVYKGELHGGLMVAIKKIIGAAEFYDDLSLIKNLEHNNIVKFIGYCHEVIGNVECFEDKNAEAEETHYFLVEEYMPNGSLDKIIYGSRLDWSSRYRIIRGIAHGLLYLHKQHFIVHADLKPSNILLDSEMNPKVTDFGIARVFQHRDYMMTRDIEYLAGTMGYMPPEYITQGILSAKYDVYSFGVVLLEIVRGMCKSEPASCQASTQWAWMARQAGQMEELLDRSLYKRYQLKEIKRCTEVGLLCTQFKPADRPTMSDVLAMLDGEKKVPNPKQPVYAK